MAQEVADDTADLADKEKVVDSDSWLRFIRVLGYFDVPHFKLRDLTISAKIADARTADVLHVDGKLYTLCMDEAKVLAATKVAAVYRGYRVRKQSAS